VAAEFGTEPTALATGPAAVTAYLLHPEDTRAAIRFGICVGGDTDTVAAMTGALVGARRGEQALVPGWVGRLRHRHRVWATAARLAGLADAA
jgi:poly(ADP-ribose) glycohydrolase ARH3